MEKDAWRPEKRELAGNSVVIEPVSVDMFFGGKSGILSSEVVHDEKFQEQARERRDLYDSLKKTFQQIGDPEMDVNAAMESGRLTVDEVIKVYEKLTHFLREDINNGRLVLYLPLALFPKETETDWPQGKLGEVKKEFKLMVKETWMKLIDESDVRASFVDGDVLETSMGEPRRVRKAGHLIPFLLPAGVINREEIDELLREAKLDDDIELASSLEDGLAAIEEKYADSDFENDRDVGDIMNKLAEELGEINRQLADGSEYAKRVSKKRLIWERKARETEVAESASRELAMWVEGGEVSVDYLEKVGLPESLEKSLIMKTLLYSIEQSLIAKRPVSEDQVTRLTQLCKNQYAAAADDLRDEIEGTFLHLKRLSILPPEIDYQFSVVAPDLTLPMPVEGKSVVERVYSSLVEAVDIIKTDLELDKIIYPFFIGIGSQIKGIAGKGSDKDAALFWRPSINTEDRQRALDLLREKCPRILEIDSMPEIWLDEVDGKICFRKETPMTPNKVSPEQIHFIFNGLWMGDEKEIRRVRLDLMERYLNLDRFGQDKNRTRSHLLGRLEMDSLQYRLMHKGFRRTYPRRNIRWLMPQIDFDSDFYEPEYRQIASLLYISKVFLPDLNLPIKSAEVNRRE